MSDVLTKVREILVEVLAVDPDAVVPDADIRQDLGLDSLGALELITVLEDEFGGAIKDEEIAAVRTVADVISLVEAHAPVPQ